MQVLAPAKINLSLRVLGRRPDGFHDIETLIAPVSLYDKIDIERQNRWIDFSCDDPSVPSGEDNLVVRAVHAFLQHTQIKSGIAIRLQKQIPHGAGLGGGSSDAAATLLALNDLFGASLSQDALVQLAQSIGSDVPFFLFRSAALCKGRGEIVEPTALNSQLSILLLKPAFKVTTSSAYSRWENSREMPRVSYAPQKFGGHEFVNDLERPVFEKFVFLAFAKAWLLKQKEVAVALMSGSGSTLFAVLRSAQAAERLIERAKAELDPELWTHRCATI